MHKRTAILILMIFSVSVSAQIKLRLPKVELPKKESAQESVNKTASTTTSGSSSKGSNRQMVIDDGFTFFDAEPLQEYSNQLRRQVGIGWYLKSRLRMFGTVPNRSAFKLVVSKAGKELAVIRCEGTPYRKGEDPVPENRNRPEDDYLLTNQRGCEDKTKAIKGTGKMDVKI